MKAIIILSGGMDSTTLLYDIINQGYEPIAISFIYGQKHYKELEAAKLTCKKLGVEHHIMNLTEAFNGFESSLLNGDIPEGHYEDEVMKSTVVPNRNMIFLSIAAGFAISKNIKHIFYGAHAGDHAIYPDCRPEFVGAMKRVLELCHYEPVILHVPYLNIDKGDIAIKGTKLNVDYSLTWTCYNGSEKPCGKCGACIERKEAFAKAGVEDPLEEG